MSPPNPHQLLFFSFRFHTTWNLVRLPTLVSYPPIATTSCRPTANKFTVHASLSSFSSLYLSHPRPHSHLASDLQHVFFDLLYQVVYITTNGYHFIKSSTVILSVCIIDHCTTGGIRWITITANPNSHRWAIDTLTARIISEGSVVDIIAQKYNQPTHSFFGLGVQMRRVTAQGIIANLLLPPRYAGVVGSNAILSEGSE